jgi:hypothetical protein
MKRLLFSLALVAAAAVALPNLGFADSMKTGSAEPLKFILDPGDGSAPSGMLLFDSESENEAQATCSMTPNGPSQPVTMEVPPPAQPIREQPYQPDMTSTPVSSYSTPPGRPGSPPRYPRDNLPPGTPDEPEPPPPTVPEPGTMLIIGLGIAGAALLRRRRSM